MSGMDAIATSEPTGLFGLGNMGAALAERLLAHGPVIAYDPDEARQQDATRLGITVVSKPEEVGAARRIVLSLPAPNISAQVIDLLCQTMAPGGTIVETSTVLPADVVSWRDKCVQAGLGLVDAALLSGVEQARAGKATLLVGGVDEDIEAVADILEAVSSSVERFGAPGSGMAAKVINNAVAHSVMVVLAEAGALAATAGIAPERIGALLGGPEGGLVRPLTFRFMQRVLQADYAGGMPTDAALKDSSLALSLANATGVPLFALQATHTVYEIAKRQGLGRDDYAGIARLWEQWIGQSMAAGDKPPTDSTPWLTPFDGKVG